ncbi:zinc finger protein 585B-like [Maniola hyperantus]|uniref:zinc finger protein 585B-like n=1 Tax=Aphantopus hyperantus TaxID=2795564 RepID=UPI0037492996
MNNPIAPDLDPLSSYNLNNYPNLESFANPLLPFGNQYPYSVKLESYQNPNYYNLPHGIPPHFTQDIANTSVNATLEDTGNEAQTVTEQDQYNGYQNNIDITEEQDIKPDISKLLNKKKIKKERSKYFSEKITEKDFKFYGCSVCNINFKELHELDNHVTTHKDRLTSYDWRVKSQIMKKKMKKELKKNKKLRKKVKAEPEMEIDIEIKPEEGYIGNEKASDFVDNTESNNQSSQENSGEKMENKDTKTMETNNVNNKQELNQETKIMETNTTNKKEELNREIKTTENNKQDSNKEINAVETNQQELDQEIKAMQNDTQELNKDTKTMETNTTNNEQELNQDINAMEINKQELNQDINAMGTNKQELNQDINAMGTNKQKLNKDINAMGTNKQELNKEITAMESNKQELNIEISAMESNTTNNRLELNVGTNIMQPTIPMPMNAANRQELLNLQKIYKCFACQKQFTLSYYLKLHVRSHTDEKPYTCGQCGQSFITASKLGRHNKRFHLAIRYQCRICYRYFSRFEFLTRHFDKKHPDDKLEGEPYDFNAILPYLKELEEQLREKTEMEKAAKKPDPWSFEVETKTELDVVKEESQDDPQDGQITVTIEQVKVDMDGVGVEVKVEELDVKEDIRGDDDDHHDDDDGFGDVKDESDHMKDENVSDDDYFPSNTWASKPAIEDPPSPKKLKLEDRVKCPICEKKFSSASYMRIHMRTHTGEKPFKCYICNAGFITSSKMHRHVLTHPESWADDDVKEEKDSKEAIDIKTEEGENTEGDKKAKKKLRMKKVLANLNKKSRASDKKKRLNQKRPHSCEYCQKRFLHLETLQVHKKCHEGESLVFKCNFCLVEYADEAARKAHEASHQGPKPYLCTICGRGYKKRETMIYHRKNHKPDREFICDICTKSFNAQCKLQRHIVSHRTQRFILRYECPVCAHMFHTKYHVQMHLATHQKEGLIQEENRSEILAMVLQNARKIPKSADAPPTLTDIVPSDERSRVCNICGEVFQHFYYLEEHLKSHGSKIAIEDSEKSEEKKHVCPICNKGFKLHYYLKLHSFTHTKEKPFICQQCGKGFITRGKLKRHIETHTGLKKYQCHVCYKFFTRPSYLRIHVRTIHGTQDYNFRMEKSYNNFGADYTP